MVLWQCMMLYNIPTGSWGIPIVNSRFRGYLFSGMILSTKGSAICTETSNHRHAQFRTTSHVNPRNPLTWRWDTPRPSFSMHVGTGVTQYSYTTPTSPILDIGHQQPCRSSVHRFFGKARFRSSVILLGQKSQQLWESFLPASIRAHSGVD